MTALALGVLVATYVLAGALLCGLAIWAIWARPAPPRERIRPDHVPGHHPTPDEANEEEDWQWPPR